MTHYSLTSLRYTLDWLVLQTIKAGLLAASVSIGAAAVQNVTACLRSLVHAHPTAPHLIVPRPLAPRIAPLWRGVTATPGDGFS